MRAGQLRQKVELFVPAEVVSDMGEIETVRESLGVFPASVEAKTQGDVSNEGTLTSVTAYTVILRYNATDLTDVTPAAFVIFNNKKLIIRSVSLLDHRKRMIEVIAEEAR
jgi:head-tail adaptor